jgi:hypothetical protein
MVLIGHRQRELNIPLWMCLSDDCLTKLIAYHMAQYGDKIPLSHSTKDVENVEEIDKLMRETRRKF